MKTTAFTEIHTSLGAKMSEFAGYWMPIEYSGIIEEHLAVCRGVGVFDVSHMGEIWVEGPHALDFLQQVTSNDVSALAEGRAQYSCIPNESGGIVDDIVVYNYCGSVYVLVVNAANIEKDWAWLKSHNPMGATLANESDRTAQLAVQGPMATRVLQRLTKENLSAMPTYSFVAGDLADREVIISHTGYTGAGGFELYFYPADGPHIWNAIFEAGDPEGIRPVGLGARDTLRLEMGYCLYGNELDDTTSPIEAGLGWITKFTDGKNFPSRALLERQVQEGTERKLCAFEMEEKAIPRHGYELVTRDGDWIGTVTSGSVSPLTRKGIGLGYVRSEYAALGTEIAVLIRERLLKARVVKLPFRHLP
ncbi:MAG: glycine cleavage system aminomethyltransferase GcvT [Tannerella sp.]|jgi:aminomethyltransferase|nr:glycine cleavage system aminomethyltransferase GcvT [Tannerella sp.]